MIPILYFSPFSFITFGYSFVKTISFIIVISCPQADSMSLLLYLSLTLKLTLPSIILFNFSWYSSLTIFSFVLNPMACTSLFFSINDNANSMNIFPKSYLKLSSWRYPLSSKIAPPPKITLSNISAKWLKSNFVLG